MTLEDPMNRREALGTLGVAAAGLTALAAADVHADEHHMHDEHFDKCAKTSADCQVQCDSCFHHCAELVSKGDKARIKTIYLCLDCAELCGTSAKLMARRSPLSSVACEACAKACDECGAACEKFPTDKHMAECAKSCRDCAKVCREMIKHLAH